jgi:hypothetical protein
MAYKSLNDKTGTELAANTTSSAGGEQFYSVSTGSINAVNYNTFGVQDIAFANHTGIGVFGGRVNGEDTYLTSRSMVKTLDLLGEGEIGGLVSGEYVPNAPSSNPDVAGQLGYHNVDFKAYSTNPEAFLRSIYLNDTPVVNVNNQYNFQNLEVSFFNGSPEGLRTGDNFLNVGQTNTIEKTRTINERIYGPDIGGNNENPWYYHSKVYRMLNPQIEKIRVNIKIAQLFYIKTEADFPEGTFDTTVDEDTGAVKTPTDEAIEDLGREYTTIVSFKYRYRPIYYDLNNNLDTSSNWYPNNPISSSIEGIVKSAYIHKLEIEPDDTLKKDNLAGWEVEITRITLDSIQSNVASETYVDSITEINEDSGSYPNSALVAMNFNAEFFSQVPTRSFDTRLLKVKVPGGNGSYDPVNRQYQSDDDGELVPWDGTFQDEKRWTDNPAWIFYDLITNKRYGLGKYLENTTIDKWTLYEISKFCDVLVPDGEGGLEPRFTCNTLINTREDAYKVLKDFASCFRAILYYGHGTIHPVQDTIKDTIAQFTNANVLDGDFNYSSSTKRSRPTVALVRYNDKTNFFKPAIEYVEDTEGIRKYGIIEKELTAFACTSRSQAIRLGRWILATEASQTEMINFTVGAEGMLLRPGDVVKVCDENRSTNKYGGRVLGYDYHPDGYHSSGILLDRVPHIESNNKYTLTLTTPSYFYDTSLVSGLSQADISGIRKSHVQSFTFDANNSNIQFGNEKVKDTITGDQSGLYIAYGGNPANGEWMFESSSKSGILVDDATWTIVDDAYATNLYTTISVKEESKFSYKVEALLHEPRKYDYVESGVQYSFIPTQYNVTVAPPGPNEVVLGLQDYDSTTTNTKKIVITVKPPADKGTTVGYRIYVKEGATFTSSDTITPAVSQPKPEFLAETIFLNDRVDAEGNPYTYWIPPRNNKTYYFRVFAVNSSSTLSTAHLDRSKEVTNHFPVKDVKIHSLRLQSERVLLQTTEDSATKTLYGTADEKDISVQWQASFLNEISIDIPIKYRVTIHEPNSNSSTPLGAIENGTFDTAETNFIYSFTLNAGTTGGPRRHFDLVVEAVDEDEITSSNGFANSTGWDIIELFNPRPTGYHLTPRKDGGRRPGDYKCCNNTCEVIQTEQFIDSDGLVVLRLLNRTPRDLAGGFMYISKHPFSGADFDSAGKPKTLSQRPNIASCLTSDEAYKVAEYEILEIPFEAGGEVELPSEIAVSPPAVAGGAPFSFNYSDAYYMAVKLYDSFDREINKRGIDPDWDKDLHIGFARDHEETAGDGKSLSGIYSFSSKCSGYYVGVYDYGVPSCTTGTFACPIYPTKYFSANAANGFRYWIRMNVNGQWEGNGIEKVRVLTHKDVQTLYNYNGFFEYSCTMNESVAGQGATYIYPNHPDSITQCRFRQGQLVGGDIHYVDDIDDENSQSVYTLYGPLQGDLEYTVTGGTVRPSTDFDVLPRAGIPYGNWGETYTTPNQNDPDGDGIVVNPETDKIVSLNERGVVIENKSRPLLGFRRYRVYFDPMNLPEAPLEGKLSSYSVVGMNSWNGDYESWPGTANWQTSLLSAKDQYSAFPVTVRSWMNNGDLFENVPGIWNHHPAGFGAGFGGLIKTQKYFDIHMGRLIDDSYLNEGFFGVVASNDYSISSSTSQTPANFDQQTGVHHATYSTNRYVTLSTNLGGDGEEKYPFD